MSHRASGFTDWVNVVEYGVVPSAVYNFASITVATFDLTISPAVGTLFTAADVGKAVLIQGAGTNSGDLWTTIATYVSPTHVTTTASAITDASAGTLVFWGHNANVGGFPSFVDQIPNLTNAINAAADATPNVGIYVPAGVYCYASSLVFGTIDAGDTLAGIRGSGQTYFVAQNPASATPQGFLNMTDLFGSMVYIGDFIVAGVTMPSTGSLTAGAEVIIWVAGCAVENVSCFSTSFTRGLHIRLTNATCRNCLDTGVSYYEPDGCVIDDCSASAAVFDLDQPDTLTAGAEGGIVTGFAAANYSPNNTQAYGNGTATITNVAVDGSNVLTITATNSFAVGQYVVFYNVGTFTFLNGQVVRILTQSTSQFTASFMNAAYGPAADTGTVVGIGLPAYITYDGVQPPAGMNPTIFIGCISTGGNTNTLPVGFQTSAALLTGCNSEGNQIGYLNGFQSSLQSCSVHDNLGSDFVSSEGQIPWVASIAYFIGQYLVDPSGHKQIVVALTGDDTSGASEPIWNDAGSTTTDNNVTWQDAGVFAGTLATYVHYDACYKNAPGEGSGAPYTWFNAAVNAEANFNYASFTPGAALGVYSTQSPIILSGLTATFTNTILYSLFSSLQSGFVVSYSFTTTTAGTGGTLTPSITWVDVNGNSQTYTGSPLSLAAQGSVNGSIFIVAKGANVTCSATVAGATGSPIYSAYVTAKQT